MNDNGNSGNKEIERNYCDMSAEQKVEVLEMILNKIPFEIWYKDVMGKYVFVNKAFADGVEKTQEECMGQLDYELFGDALAVKYRQADWEFLFGEEKGAMQFNNIDGHQSLEFKESATDAEGTYRGIVGCDIASRIRDIYEYFIRDNTSIFRIVFDGSPFGMAIYQHGESVPHMVNNRFCEILGLSEFTALNTDWRIYTHPDDIEANEAPLGDFRTGLRQSFTMEKRFIRPSGEIVWTKMTVMKLRLPDGGEFSLCILDEREPHEIEGSDQIKIEDYYYE